MLSFDIQASGVSWVWKRVFPSLGNARFCRWEREFLQVETTVSAGGNDSFRKWERQFPHMGTRVSIYGNDCFAGC